MTGPISTKSARILFKSWNYTYISKLCNSVNYEPIFKSKLSFSSESLGVSELACYHGDGNGSFTLKDTMILTDFGVNSDIS